MEHKSAEPLGLIGLLDVRGSPSRQTLLRRMEWVTCGASAADMIRGYLVRVGLGYVHVSHGHMIRTRVVAA